jgi:hypothetical protein
MQPLELILSQFAAAAHWTFLTSSVAILLLCVLRFTKDVENPTSSSYLALLDIASSWVCNWELRSSCLFKSWVQWGMFQLTIKYQLLSWHVSWVGRCCHSTASPSPCTHWPAVWAAWSGWHCSQAQAMMFHTPNSSPDCTSLLSPSLSSRSRSRSRVIY